MKWPTTDGHHSAQLACICCQAATTAALNDDLTVCKIYKNGICNASYEVIVLCVCGAS